VPVGIPEALRLGPSSDELETGASLGTFLNGSQATLRRFLQRVRDLPGLDILVVFVVVVVVVVVVS